MFCLNCLIGGLRSFSALSWWSRAVSNRIVVGFRTFGSSWSGADRKQTNVPLKQLLNALYICVKCPQIRILWSTFRIKSVHKLQFCVAVQLDYDGTVKCWNSCRSDSNCTVASVAYAQATRTIPKGASRLGSKRNSTCFTGLLCARRSSF